MEADCHIFFINLVYWFFQFDIWFISFDKLGISFLMLLSLSGKPVIIITIVFCLVFCTKSLI